jgi:putative DNA methylase
MERFDQLFTDRQNVALTTFADLVLKARDIVHKDFLSAEGLNTLGAGDVGESYANAVAVYLAFGVDKMADRHCSLCTWDPTPTASGILHVFARQALPMTWDFVEGNPFSTASGNFEGGIGWIAKAIEGSLPATIAGFAVSEDASIQTISTGKIVSTDPPYYDNVPYADLSDFFYVWLRRALKSVFPDVFTTLAVPKVKELVAFAHRHDTGKSGAEGFFLHGMTDAMHRLSELAHPAFPITIYYAFKQAESDDVQGTSSTGWETFLEAVIRAGFAINGTWPMRTELANRMRGIGSNALASSIILVCRNRELSALTATRREFVTVLKSELPVALAHLQRSNTAPVDLAQAAIGPGMAVFTRYAKVVDTDGKALRVREALSLINQTLDEALAEQEGDFDPDTRWALTWFEQSGFDEGDFGSAEQLSKSKNTSVSGLVEAGFLASGRGKVRLLKPDELEADWDPSTDSRLTAWEMVHQMIAAQTKGGDTAASALLAKLGTKAEVARELAYRLYNICERKKRNQEALWYNSLVQSWPELMLLAHEVRKNLPKQGDMFEQETE